MRTLPACLVRRESLRIFLCWTVLTLYSKSRISVMFLSLIERKII